MAAPEPWSLPPAPPLPESITSVSDSALRRCAESAWNAGHALTAAITGWTKWATECRKSDEGDGAAWIDRGDAIADTARAAFRALKRLPLLPGALDLPDDLSGPNVDLPIVLPPSPSSYIGTIDYLEPSESERQRIDSQWFTLEGVTGQEVRIFLRGLEQFPESVFEPPCYDESWETAPRLARLWGIAPNALSQGLRRWRVEHPACFGVTDAKVKYVYLVGAVRGLLDKMASDH